MGETLKEMGSRSNNNHHCLCGICCVTDSVFNNLYLLFNFKSDNSER